MRIEKLTFYPSIKYFNPKNYNERALVITALVITIILLVGTYYVRQAYHRFVNKPSVTPTVEEGTDRAKARLQKTQIDSNLSNTALFAESNVVKMSIEQQAKFESAIAQLINPPIPDHEGFWRSVEEEKKNLSTEIASIDKLFQLPDIQKLVSTIRKKSGQNLNIVTDTLFVILGIKPVLALDLKEWNSIQRLCPFLNKTCSALPEIKIIDENPSYYIINESPLEIFDPRYYLKGCQSLSQEILPKNLLSDSKIKKDQRLAYLLGYGPTWEAYQHHWTVCLNLYVCNTERTSSEYGKKHFEQLGQVIKSCLAGETSFTEEELGRYYHYHFESCYPPTNAQLLEQKFSCVHSKTPLSKIRGPVQDNLSIKTTYFRQRLFLRKYVLSKLGFSEEDQLSYLAS